MAQPDVDAPSADAPRSPPLVALARRASSDAAARSTLGTALREIRPTRANAEALATLLESTALDGVRLEGRSAREVVIERLLMLDIHALQVPPEQLRWLRGRQRQRRFRVVLAWGLSAAAASLWTLWLLAR